MLAVDLLVAAKNTASIPFLRAALRAELAIEHSRFHVGISVDHVWSHAAFAHDARLLFPLLADFQPRGAVAPAYGVYRPRQGVSARALFVLNSSGSVHFGQRYPDMLNPGVDGILTALEDLARLGDTAASKDS